MQGCIVAAVGAGIGAVKYGNSKQVEAQAKTKEAYNQYVIQMSDINFKRQRAGLVPEHIMSYEEYTGIKKEKR